MKGFSSAAKNLTFFTLQIVLFYAALCFILQYLNIKKNLAEQLNKLFYKVFYVVEMARIELATS